MVAERTVDRLRRLDAVVAGIPVVPGRVDLLHPLLDRLVLVQVVLDVLLGLVHLLLGVRWNRRGVGVGFRDRSLRLGRPRRCRRWWWWHWRLRWGIATRQTSGVHHDSETEQPAQE